MQDQNMKKYFSYGYIKENEFSEFFWWLMLDFELINFHNIKMKIMNFFVYLIELDIYI
jgi:hypothetical protein